MVVFWRVFQALGACVGPMLSRAMIRDSYGVTEAARTLSTLAMIMAVAPIAGPLLGGALLTIGTWKLIFWVKVVILDHGRSYSTIYAHLSSSSVREGQVVGAGSVIGRVGRTGTATGYHLHFEVRVGSTVKNPLDYLKR